VKDKTNDATIKGYVTKCIYLGVKEREVDGDRRIHNHPALVKEPCRLNKEGSPLNAC
jgi:hypothetical protein